MFDLVMEGEKLPAFKTTADRDRDSHPTTMLQTSQTFGIENNLSDSKG